MCRAPPPEDGVEATETADSDMSMKSTKQPAVTKQELSSHNNPQNAWAAIHGRVVDLTDFASRHPGGDVILLAAGRDATALFETYHPRGVPDALLDKLQVGVMKEGEISSSFYSWESDFYKVMKRRVVKRLAQRGLSRRGSYEIWIKAVLILTGFWGSLFRMYVASTFLTAAMWSASMGIFAAFVGTCIQHDGNHGAFANGRLPNKVAGWTLDMIGASAFTWEFQHMLGHHPYTNLLDSDEEKRKETGVDCPMVEKDQESDPDVFSSFPAMRMHPLHKQEWFHRYQHIYGPLLFAFMTLSKVFQQDIQVVLSKRLYHIDANCRYGSVLNIFRFWVMKAVTLGYMLGLPCYYQGITSGIALFLLGHFTCGEVLATMFIVNHVIEGVSFAEKSEEISAGGKVCRPKTVFGTTPMEKTKSKVERENGKTVDVPYNDWAAVQCQTSVNWAPGSWFWNHFSGGLSHQIEHHLFPSICHTNYVHIQDVVEQTCNEYGVPYQSEPSFLGAYKKMLSHLKYLGTEKKEC